MTLTTLLADCQSVLTAVTGWMTAIFNAAVASPVVVLFIGLAVVGVAVGFAKKLLHI